MNYKLLKARKVSILYHSVRAKRDLLTKNKFYS